jgi:hypothetical protein
MPRASHFDRPIAARFLVAAALLATALGTAAQFAARTTTVQVAGHALRVEVVSTPAGRSTGLMNRMSLAKNDGMLFLFDEPGYHSMWMKNTFIPLSVAFLDGEGRIINILDMEPHSLDMHMATGPALYAIETNKGWFAERKVKAGDKVTGLPRK